MVTMPLVWNFDIISGYQLDDILPVSCATSVGQFRVAERTDSTGSLKRTWEINRPQQWGIIGNHQIIPYDSLTKL